MEYRHTLWLVSFCRILFLKFLVQTMTNNNWDNHLQMTLFSVVLCACYAGHTLDLFRGKDTSYLLSYTVVLKSSGGVRAEPGWAQMESS